MPAKKQVPRRGRAWLQRMARACHALCPSFPDRPLAASRRLVGVPEGQWKLAGDFSHRILGENGCVPAGTPEDSGIPSADLLIMKPGDPRRHHVDPQHSLRAPGGPTGTHD